eukprot:484354_1
MEQLPAPITSNRIITVLLHICAMVSLMIISTSLWLLTLCVPSHLSSQSTIIGLWHPVQSKSITIYSGFTGLRNQRLLSKEDTFFEFNELLYGDEFCFTNVCHMSRALNPSLIAYISAECEQHLRKEENTPGSLCRGRCCEVKVQVHTIGALSYGEPPTPQESRLQMTGNLSHGETAPSPESRLQKCVFHKPTLGNTDVRCQSALDDDNNSPRTVVSVPDPSESPGPTTEPPFTNDYVVYNSDKTPARGSPPKTRISKQLIHRVTRQIISSFDLILYVFSLRLTVAMASNGRITTTHIRSTFRDYSRIRMVFRDTALIYTLIMLIFTSISLLQPDQAASLALIQATNSPYRLKEGLDNEFDAPLFGADNCNKTACHIAEPEQLLCQRGRDIGESRIPSLFFGECYLNRHHKSPFLYFFQCACTLI